MLPKLVSTDLTVSEELFVRKPLTSTPVIILTPNSSTFAAKEYIALVWFEYPPFFS